MCLLKENVPIDWKCVYWMKICLLTKCTYWMKMCLLKGHNPLSINSSLYSFDNLFSTSFLSSFLEAQETCWSSSKLLFIESNRFGCILRINLWGKYCLRITFNYTSKSIKFSICVLDQFVISLYYSSKIPIVWTVDFFVRLFFCQIVKKSRNQATPTVVTKY